MEFHLFKGRNVSLHPCSTRLPNCLLVLLSFVLHSLSRVYYSVETVAFLSPSLSTFLFQQAAIKTRPVIHFSKLSRGVQHLFHFYQCTRAFISFPFFFFLSSSRGTWIYITHLSLPLTKFFLSLHFSRFTSRKFTGHAAILLKIRFNVVNSWQSLLGIISSRSWRGSVDYEREKSRTLVTKWLIGGKKKKKKKDIRRTKKKTWEHSFKFMAGKISFVESNWTSVHRVAGCKSYVYLL